MTTRRIAQLIATLSTVTLLASGCSYTKTLEPNLSIESINETRQPHVLAIDGRKLTLEQTTALPGVISLTVVHGDALLESIKHRLKNSYKEIYVIRSNKDIKEYDYLMSVSNRIESACGMGNYCTLNAKTHINLENSKKELILKSDFVDDFLWTKRGSVISVAIVSGLTLCAICPITVPTMTYMCGEELLEQISLSNDRISFRIAEEILKAN